jgi:hypothetical protein
VEGEYPGRGELLPYLYYLKHKLFDIAVVLHDSVFVNKYIDFNVEKYKMLWQFEHDWDQVQDETPMIQLFNDPELCKFYTNKSLWKGCFGGMSVITHDYLTRVNQVHPLHLLLDKVKTRYNRMSFERVIAALLQYHSMQPSLLGDIHTYCNFSGRFEDRHVVSHLPLIKVWTGR